MDDPTPGREDALKVDPRRLVLILLDEAPEKYPSRGIELLTVDIVFVDEPTSTQRFEKAYAAAERKWGESKENRHIRAFPFVQDAPFRVEYSWARGDDCLPHTWLARNYNED